MKKPYRIINIVIGMLNSEQLKKLSELCLDRERANMHYGLNAQVDANRAMFNYIESVFCSNITSIKEMRENELIKKISEV